MTVPTKPTPADVCAVLVYELVQSLTALDLSLQIASNAVDRDQAARARAAMDQSRAQLARMERLLTDARKRAAALPRDDDEDPATPSMGSAG